MYSQSLHFYNTSVSLDSKVLIIASCWMQIVIIAVIVIFESVILLENWASVLEFQSGRSQEVGNSFKEKRKNVTTKGYPINKHWTQEPQAKGCSVEK